MAYGVTINDLICLLGGLIPTLFWLWFWLQEDNHPEPKYVIFGTFLVGAASTFVALPIEQYLKGMIPAGFALILVWSLIEEATKYAATAWSAFAAKSYDEPVDAMVYMITASLGFAAFENVLFLIKALNADGMAGFWLTSNIRFIGATLLHVVSSATVGAAIGLSFYKSMATRIVYASIGLLCATGLHALFNFFILQNNGQESLSVFGLLWVCVIVIFLLFEEVKKVKTNQRINNETKTITI